MAKQVQYRRGTTAQLASFAGAQGEITVDITKKVVVVHDGTTLGGVPGATAAQITAANSAINSTRSNVAILQANTLSLATQITSLVSNASTQQDAIESFLYTANTTAILDSIAAVQSDVDTIEGQLISIESNVGVARANSLEATQGVALANIAIVDLRANITASNVRISSLEAGLTATNAALVDIALSPTIISGMSTALDIPSLTANTVTQALQINALNANIAAANAAIVDISLSPYVIDAVIASVNETLLNELAQDIDSLFDANLQDARITSLESGITAANVAIETNATNIGLNETAIGLVNSNVDAVVDSLANTDANVVLVNEEIADLWANAAEQTEYIDNLIGSAPAALDTLYEIANALGNDPNLSTTLLTEISSVQANVTAANAAIVVLQSNAAAQAVTLNTLSANAGAQAVTLNTLSANAGAQADLINELTSNTAGLAEQISTLSANAGSQADTLASLESNAASQATLINTVNANVTAANVNIETLQSQVYTDSNVAAYLLANPESGTYTNANVTAYLPTHTGNVSADYVDANFFIGNAALMTGFPIGDFVFANTEISVTGQDLEFTVDARTWTLGTDGNLTLASDSAVAFADGLGTIFGNIEITDGLHVGGDVIIGGSGTLVFPDETVQTTANIMQASFTMANAGHWTESVSTIGDALNQLAARLYAIENP